MKRYTNVYSAIKDPDNIRLAFLKAARGKRDKTDVAAFASDFEANIQNLYNQLDNLCLDVGHYHFFKVWDPKQRMICAASFPERVLHHAIMNICEPTLDRYAIFDSYACRNGKGLHRAVYRARQYAGKYPWFLKLDIRKYFDSIDHGILMNMLEKRFKDKPVLEIFRQIVDTYETGPGCGLPIGNLVSQHMANFYLGIFDHWVKETLRIKGYVRYMDDFILFGPDQGTLKSSLRAVQCFLGKTLKLELKDDIQLNRSRLGIPFLGYRVFPGYTRLAVRSKKRFLRKFRQYEKQRRLGLWSEQEFTAHVEPLVEFTKLANAKGFRANVINQFGAAP